MQTIIHSLSSIPGVMGALLSDERGNILAHSFPAYFDTATIKGVAELLQDNTVGLHDATGGVKLFDIRYELGRVIVKPLPRVFVVLLCQSTVNIQLLFISLNVAIKKIEKLSSDPLFFQNIQQTAPQVQAPPVEAAVPQAASAAPGRYRAVSDGKGILLTNKIMTTPDALFGVESVCINRNTSLGISDIFGTGPFKKLMVTNPANGVKKRVPVAVMHDDLDGVYDGVIFPSKSLLESLRVKEGEQLRVEIVIDKGFFG